MTSIGICFYLFIVINLMVMIVIPPTLSLNKYSQEANQKVKSAEKKSESENGGAADKPFRMAKLNLLWEKAQKKLSGQKLKNLQSDLKLQDKDELTLKKMKSEGSDKDGLREAELRRRLNAVIAKYDLSSHFDETAQNSAGQYSTPLPDEHWEKQIFKDKKLDKLWKKAEKSGLSDEQLKILKEEFKHHEDKISQYYQLVTEVDAKEVERKRKGDDWENSIERVMHDEQVGKGNTLEHAHQVLKEKHKQIKDGYQQLTERVSSSIGDGDGGVNEDFEEVKVQTLWQLAKKSDFTQEELESLKEELKHYQNRIKKLRHFEMQLESDHIAGKDVDGDENEWDVGGNGEKHVKRRVKELSRKVIKLHSEIENRIMQRHVEL